MSRRYKVVQWATGSKGLKSLRAVLRDPDLELVGLRVYGADKVGRDAGEIAGMGPVGVVATDRDEDILALDADVVLYMAQVRLPMDAHDTAVRRLLASGKNVIAITGYYWPWTHGQAYADSFEAAGREGGATLFGTGWSPGLFSERMAVQLTEGCTRVDSIHYLEVADCSRNVATMVVDVMGCGRPPDEARLESYTTDLTTWYHYEVLDAMAHWLGVTLDEKRTELSTVLATEDETTPAGILIRKGTVGATVRKWIGLRDGRPFITSEHRWTVVSHIPGFEPRTCYRITIEGRPAYRMEVEMAEAFEAENPDPAEHPLWESVVAPAINAIPTVVAAPPGILRAPVFSPRRSRMT